MSLNVKKGLLSLILGVFLISGVSADAMGSGKPAAFVNLFGERIVIGMTELNQKLANYQAAATQNGADASKFTQSSVLDILINDEIVVAGAKHEGIVATDDIKEKLYTSNYNSYATQYNKSTGKDIDRATYDKQIATAYGSVDAFKTTLGEQYVLSQYLKAKEPTLMDASSISISDDEISSFYRTNKTQFVNPESAKIAQIFIPFDADNKSADQANKTRLENVVKMIKANSITFEAAVTQYSQDTGSVNNGGEIGWVTMDDTQGIQKILGESFFNTCMSTPVGEISSVVTSTSGYHIIKVLSHIQAKFLALTDPINPDSKVTVKSYIGNYLGQAKAKANYQQAIADVIQDLRKQASIQKLV